MPNPPRLARSRGVHANIAPVDRVLYLVQPLCGTKICRKKGIEYARRVLGHSNISTTHQYMHLDDRDFADAQDLVHLDLHGTSEMATEVAKFISQ